MGDLNSDIVIRQFRVEDLPQVVEESEAYLQESLNSDLSDIEGIYITPGGNLWVATLKPDPTKVLGFVGLEPKDNKEGELRRISSLTREMGSRERVSEKCGDDGGGMVKARAFYSSMGFTQTAITVVSEDPYFEAYTFENSWMPFSAEDLELVVTLLKDGMMHYPAHKIHAEVLHQHITEALTTGDLRSIEATYINPGGNFWVAIPRSEPAEVVGMVALEA
ncbi:Acyl-CoA N-acyltransferase [Phytophthora cactorum]|nr:Acyl-CoA N-acyltransferase [Phytophthora cactorum]